MTEVTNTVADLSPFLNISLILIIVAGMAAIMNLLRQPLIIGHIISGMIVGPIGLNIVQYNHTVEVFAHFGTGLLLFIIGLGLNPKIIKEVGRVAVTTGVLQVLITASVGWLIALALGYNSLTSLAIGVILAFSSTIIILKLLFDKKEQHRLYGRILLGFLLVQDIIAAIALIVATTAIQDSLSVAVLGEILLGSLLVVAGVWVTSHFLLTRIHSFLSRSSEFLFLFAIAWGLGVVYLFHLVGLSSIEVGALAAGVALATQPYATNIGIRLRPLRDFFIVMLFVTIGSEIAINNLETLLPQALILSALVLIGNPIIVMSIMGFLRFGKKTSFKAGLAVAQISEFSLLLAGLVAIKLKQPQLVSLVAIVALITITLSSYMIIYSEQIYNKIGRYLDIFQRKQLSKRKETLHSPEMILVGYHRGGEQFVKSFKKLKKDYLVIDYNPKIIDELALNGIPHLAGDVCQVELLDEVSFDRVNLVVSTLTDFVATKILINWIVDNHPEASVICSANDPGDAIELYGSGATYVIIPHYISTNKILSLVSNKGVDQSTLVDFGEKHLKILKQRQAVEKKSSQPHHFFTKSKKDPKQNKAA